MRALLPKLLLLVFAGCGIGGGIWLATATEEGTIAQSLLEKLPPRWAAAVQPAIEQWHSKSVGEPDGKPTSEFAITAPRGDLPPSPSATVLAPHPRVGNPFGSDETLNALLKVVDKALDNQNKAAPLPAAPTPQPEPVPRPQPENPFREDPRAGAPLPAGPSSITATEATDTFSVHFDETDIRQALKMLSEQASINILPTASVQGTVSASLPDVDIETALNALLKSKGYISRREGNIVYVGTAEEFEQQALTTQFIATRLYRPNYVTAAELQRLIMPLLTPGISFVSVTSPAEHGIEADDTGAGGDNYAQGEVLLVRDYEYVLSQVDQVVAEVDVPPLQVAIEAMVLSVKLDDSNSFGVDFELLRNKDNVRIISGNPVSNLANITTTDNGLKVGFLDSSTSLFLEALETIGDTNVIATPKLLCLNKQRAEILIGQQLGYVSTTQTETSTTQSVEFLEVGTQLRIRPYISGDGMIRMEVHPEVSSGQVRVESNFTLPDKEVTTVTTNIMARDGSTVVIGGLIREELKNTATQIPFFGSLPYLGPAFRQQREETDRQEILVLITPRIVSQAGLAAEGDRGALEFHHRQAVYAHNMSPLGKRHLGRHYFLKAQQAWAAGNRRRALQLADRSVKIDPENRAAIDLRADIYEGVQFGDHTMGAEFIVPPPPPAIVEDGLQPWMIEELGYPADKLPQLYLPQHAGPPLQVDIVNPQQGN